MRDTNPFQTCFTIHPSLRPHVEDLKFHQSLLDRILRIGAITVASHDETTPRLLLRALPNPRPVFETLKQRIITVKRQRGVIKLDAG